MIRRFNKYKEKKQFFRINERIFAQSVRVLDSTGAQIGVLSRNEALEKAREDGLDLVEIAPKAIPPVVKIIDFNKFLYQQEKKKKEERKNTKVSETKEVRLSPNIGDHDLEVMVRRAKDFLEDKDKVRFVVKFAGRQIVHPERGQETLGRVLEQLKGVSKVERPAHFEGRQLVAIVVPEKKKAYGKNEDKKISTQEVQNNQKRESSLRPPTPRTPSAQKVTEASKTS